MNTAETSQHTPAIELDEDGLLLDPEHWNRETALILANQLGIELVTSDHWKVIDALRQHYSRFGVAATIHNICHANHQKEDWVHQLFHSCFNAWRVAGLPDPGEEAKAYLSDM